MSERVKFENETNNKNLGSTENKIISIDLTNDILNLDKKIAKLTEENNELKEKIFDIEKKERLRGVYQILADLNSANKNIKELKAQLEQKESELNSLKENSASVADNKEEQEKISEYEKAIEHLNKKVDYLMCENSKANEMLKQKEQRNFECEAALEDRTKLLSEAEEKLNDNFTVIHEHVKNAKSLIEKINGLEEFKASLFSELEFKNNTIYMLQQENLTLKRDNQELVEFKAQALLKFAQIDLEPKATEAADATAAHKNLNLNNLNNDDLNAPNSPNRSSINYNNVNFNDHIHRKFSSENFGLAENLKDDLQTLYSKSLKKTEMLKRDNEKLNVHLSALKDEHKIEVMRLNLTIEELLKIASNATDNNNNNNNSNSEESEANKVSTIVKNIQSKINESTIEEMKKEKAGYLETIGKLKLQVEALESANNLDNLSDKYLQTDTFVHHMSPQKAMRSETNLHKLDDNKENPNINNKKNNDNNNNNNDNNENANINDHEKSNCVVAGHTNHLSVLESEVINVNELMEKNQNEIRERERKIEYLLQILEEKNNLIEQLRDSDKITSSNHSIEAKETLEFLQFQNENLLKEIEDKNAKIKKLNKDYNDKVAKFELLQADFLELQEKENEITIYTDEIELLKNKNKEYEILIEKMNKELNVKSNNLLRKEKEVNSLKADRANNTMNKSILENTFNNYNNKQSVLMENNPNNITNGSIIKDPKIEFLNNSLNEIRDLKDKLKQNNLNRSMRSRRGNSNDSLSNNNSNNSIYINTTNQNIPRVLFEEDVNNNAGKKKINNVNNSLNSMNNSLDADTTNFNLGNISKINLNDVHAVNSEIENVDEEANAKKANNNLNKFVVNNQALFVSDYSSNINNNNYSNNKNNNNNYFSVGSNYNTNNLLNNNNNYITTYENYNTNPNSNIISTTQIMHTNQTYSNNNNINKEILNTNYTSVPIESASLKLNLINNNNNDPTTTNPLTTTIVKTDFSNPNIRVKEPIQAQDILQSQENWDLIRTWVANSLQKEKNKFFFSKIFKASENGFNSASFYSKAETKAPTLIILHTNHGKIIGGFTPIAWKMPVNSIDFLEDSTKAGFLFSVNIGKKYDIKENSIAVCHSIGCGPVFGLNDLEIVENADRNYNYFSNIGTSYCFEDKMEDFYGSAKYLVEDYEAYEVLFV